MLRLRLARYIVLGIAVALMAAAAGAASAVLPAGQANAQPEPTIELLPASGPCDGVVDMRGTGFEPPADPTEFQRLYLVRPGTEDVAMREVAGGLVRSDGTFVARMGPHVARCDVAALDSEAEQPSGHLVIAATASRDPVSPGERIPGIIAVARYAYTTTSPPADPLAVVSPSTGPCDAPLEVRGRGFEPQGGAGSDLLLYLVRPGALDINMDLLNPASTGPDGAFSEWVGMWRRGCEAAGLDSEAEVPTGHVVIAVASRASDMPTGEGDRIPNIVATAQYEYTTTAPHVPTEALSIVPPSGPCDGTVQVSGSGFEPGLEVVLKLASPSGEFGVATLGSAVADDSGGFQVEFSFGQVGCRTAGLIREYGAGGELAVGAFPAVYPIPAPPGRPDPLAWLGYAFTTVSPGGAAVPGALPQTGSGPGAEAGPPRWLVLIGPLAGLGLVLVMASLYLRRKRT